MALAWQPQTGSFNSATGTILGQNNQAAVVQTGYGNHLSFSQTGNGNIINVTSNLLVAAAGVATSSEKETLGMVKQMNTTVVALSFGALLFLPAVAVAGSDNTLNILQTGAANTLHVDQSDASGSTVGGFDVGSSVDANDVLSSIVDVNNSPALQNGAKQQRRHHRQRH